MNNSVLKRVFQILSKKQKMYSFLVMVCAVAAALFETLGVSAIVPLVDAILQPRELWNNEYIGWTADRLNIATDTDLVIAVIVTIIILYVFKNLFFMVNAWVKIKYAVMVERETSIYMMNSYMRRGYEFFLEHNFSEIRHGVEMDVVSLFYVIIDLIQIATQVLIIFLISIYMCITNFTLFIGVITSGLVGLIVIAVFFRKRMKIAGEKVRKYSIDSGKTLTEAVHGIQEVLAMRKQRHFIERYNREATLMNKYDVTRTVGSEIPAYIIEMICIIGIMSSIGINIVSGGGDRSFFAVLASFAVGAFRILPAIGRISASVNQINSCRPGLDAVYNNICAARAIPEEVLIERDQDDKMTFFTDRIEMKGICFKYNNSENDVLSELNMSINKEDSIAIVGESGSGKTTLSNLLLGVLRPQKGQILVDNIDITTIPNSWSRMIGFVPQNIYLLDATIRENVAFGVNKEDIDEDIVCEALKRANIWDFVVRLEDGIDTNVGDMGVRLSGGQKQRIGIARALYRRPEILILDEATSALDRDTESVVMESIESLRRGLTLIIIAHRLTTIRKCNVIYEIKDGKANERKYEEII